MSVILVIFGNYDWEEEEFKNNNGNITVKQRVSLKQINTSLD
jgi:hypothetical protein